MMGSIFKENCIVLIAFLPKSYQLFLDVLLNFTNVKGRAWVELSFEAVCPRINFFNFQKVKQ